MFYKTLTPKIKNFNFMVKIPLFLPLHIHLIHLHPTGKIK